ncbi:PREDICTED: uncharacterized protein LOC106100364 [Papilio polytes]|uniref:uncharacterized protein LOC106100364 n=1 Tax=Papilio polytes TaxID=76194 RepID=UPI0006768A27|nr:PREDICTED: uncharacterized protein LOC106100364 [Papilio polytes]
MKPLINKNLITLKCVLFCFLSGIGCIYPFLSLHMLATGLDRAEARLISAVAPCIALLGPAILGPLVDKLSVGRGSTGGGHSPSGSGRLLRVVTAICLIARRPQVLFMCDAEGAYVMQEVCTEGMRCNTWPGQKKGVLAVGTCEYGCASDDMSWLTEPFLTTTTTTTLSPMYNSVANATPSSELVTEDGDEGPEFERNPPHLCTDAFVPGLAYSTSYWWVAACALLQVFTLSLVWVTAVLYFRHLVPKKYTTTGQALPVIAHFCIGRCIGAIVGGLVSLSAPLEAQRGVYRALGVAALAAAALYLALYHLLLAPRCAAPPAPPPHTLLQGLNANGASNGTYSPMRVYHEERSRKGHFRY